AWHGPGSETGPKASTRRGVERRSAAGYAVADMSRCQAPRHVRTGSVGSERRAWRRARGVLLDHMRGRAPGHPVRAAAPMDDDLVATVVRAERAPACPRQRGQ